MEIKLDLQVPANYFFQQLVASVLQDIKQQTGQQVNAQVLAGFHYRKRFSNRQTGELKITHFVQDHRYAYALKTGRNLYEVDYELTATSPESCSLLYIETQNGRDPKVSANNKVVSLLMGWYRKRRFKKMAEQISTSYQARQKGDA